jgi:myo-inositol-1-phosphate synthase
MLKKKEDVDPETQPNDTKVKPTVDKARILSEASTQYALIETAHTMKLINVSPTDIARQCEFLVTEYA